MEKIAMLNFTYINSKALISLVSSYPTNAHGFLEDWPHSEYWRVYRNNKSLNVHKDEYKHLYKFVQEKLDKEPLRVYNGY